MRTRTGIETLYLGRSPQSIWHSLRNEDRRIVSQAALARLSCEELAYVLWRMHFEQKTTPALLEPEMRTRAVWISAASTPGSWWSVSRRLWAILFRASYVSLLMDIQLALDDGVSVADIFRLPADRNYLILPRNDTRFAAGGLLIYPILGRKSAET